MSKTRDNLSSANKHRRTALQLTFLAGVCLLLIFALFSFTQGKVKQNERDYLYASLSRVLPAGVHLSDFDNGVLDNAQTLGGLTIYPACRDGQLQYALVEMQTDKGYSGTIRLLAGVDVQENRLSAVRPLFHQETPGLGDQIDPDKSDWLKQFELPLTTHKTLSVKKDGGDIDAITGATITSRAVANVLANSVFSQDFSHTHCNTLNNKEGNK